MKEIIINKDNLTQKEIDEVVTRVKAIIINSNNELLLGYSNKTYQFPGGHVEENEELVSALERELKEETGMVLDLKNIKPFKKITYYVKNYRDTNKNRENDIYYYIVKTDEEINMNNSHLDEFEKAGNYVVKKVPLNKVKEILLNSVKDNEINEIIVEEMLWVLDSII